MSSWISAALWNVSMAAAAGSALRALPPTASAPSRQRAGRVRLPPPRVKSHSGTYR